MVIEEKFSPSRYHSCFVVVALLLNRRLYRDEVSYYFNQRRSGREVGGEKVCVLAAGLCLGRQECDVCVFSIQEMNV